MRALFAHDHKFRFDNGYFSPGGLSNEVLSRYVNLFETVEIVARVIPVKSNDKQYSRIDNPNVTIFNINSREMNIDKLVSKVDCVIARLPSVTGLKAIGAAKKNNKPYMIELVGCPWDSFWNHSLKGKIVAPFMWYLTKIEVKIAPFVLYVTDRFLQERYPCKYRCVGCSDVALTEFDENTIKKRKEKIVNGHKKLVVGTIAAIDVAYKGQKYVIDAIARLNKEGFNVLYEVVGGGDPTFLLNESKKYGVEDKVNILGAMQHDQVFGWLDTIDIYIQPSEVEGLSRALLEAMSRGCPCIVSSAGGNPELIEKEYIFSNGAVQEICDILCRMDTNVLLKQAERNYEFSKKFEGKLLEVRRTKFMGEFRKHVIESNREK